MNKVFNATYKTDNVYAEGFIIFSEDYKEIEGVFALDYAFIYNTSTNTLLNLKPCFWDCGIRYSFNEFSTCPVEIKPDKTFLFYNNSGEMLTLEIKDEVLNVFQIQDVLLTLSSLRG